MYFSWGCYILVLLVVVVLVVVSYFLLLFTLSISSLAIEITYNLQCHHVKTCLNDVIFILLVFWLGHSFYHIYIIKYRYEF